MKELTHYRRNSAGGSFVLYFAAAFFVSLLATSIISADERLGSAEFTKRFYVNGGVGVTRIEPESPTPALTVSDNSDTGFHLALGYDFNRFLSVEGYVAELGTADIDFLGAPVGTVDYQVFGVSALGYLYNSRSGFSLIDDDIDGLFRREGLSLYGRLGIGHMRNDAENVDYFRDHPSHAAFGLGLEYGFSNGFALRTEIMSLDTDARYLNVGLLKRFGSVPVPAVKPLDPPVAVPLPIPTPKTPEPPALPEPIVAPKVYFAFDKSDLTAEFTSALDQFAADWLKSPSDLVIEGHTDWIAPEEYNMSLSLRRAESVSNYLRGQGVPGNRMTIVGYGETRPVSSNNTAEGRALNRRVEIFSQ